MGFSRRFPRDVKGSPYASWEEIFLSADEEKSISKEQREANIKLMQECLKDAQQLITDEKMKDFQTNAVQIAISLFNQRSSHLVYWKEEKAKQRFDDMFLKK